MIRLAEMTKTTVALTSCAIALFACGGHSDTDVASWDGPPVHFAGSWRADTVQTEMGPLDAASVDLEFGVDSPTSAFLTVPTKPGFCMPWDMNMMATATPDGHGFDGSLSEDGLESHAKIHGRAAADGSLHVRIEITAGKRQDSQTMEVVDSCTDTWTFVASHFVCSTIAGVQRCVPAKA